MSKIFVVFGATGQQGGSIINTVLNDPELSQKFKIRAVTRDVNSEKAKSLEGKVEVVRGDPNDRQSVEAALSGASFVFILTNPVFDGSDTEYNSAKTVADVAVEKSLEYIIFSTLPPISDISGGQFTKVVHFDGKYKAEQYIRGLKIKSAFVSLGCYMENFRSQTFPFFVPKNVGNDTWAITLPNSPKAKWPLICATEDTGKFVGAILAAPDKYNGKTFSASTEVYTLDEAAAAISKSTGKKVVYQQVPQEEFKKNLPFAAETITETFSFGDYFQYYGPETEKLVAWSVENARGKPTTFVEFLAANPIVLT